MRVESVNGKKYILVIVDDYSRFTWVKFLRSKDETPMFIIKFLKMIQGRKNRGQGTNPHGGGVAGYGGVQNRVRNANPDKMLLMQAQENEVALDEEQLLFLAGRQDTAIDEDVDEQPVQDLALNVDNVFQADDCDAFDYDVDEAPTAQTMFMANLSSADPVNDKVGPSYDSYILSKVQDHDHYQDVVCAHQEEHVMHDNVQLNYVLDSHADYTIDSNMIPYDQYVKDNAVLVVHNDVSSVPNYAYMKIYNDMYEPQEVTSMKKDFKQKENKYLKDFLDMKSLKEKVEDRLFKQDQPLQIVHMLCRPKPYYNELSKVVIRYKNPLCLTREKQVQPTLYNGHEIINYNHVPAIVHNTEDTLEIAEITKRKMNDKMIDPECMTHKRITPTGLTEEERGFEQTKACYLKEVILFFQTLKENFEGIQKALTKEIKEMKDVFEELEAELKYQNLKDGLGNNPPTPDKDTPDFDSVFVIGKMQASLQGKDNVIRQLKKQISHFVSKEHVKPKVLEPGKYAIDVEPIVPRLRNNRVTHLDYLRHLKESVETIRDIVEEAKVVRPLDSSVDSACRYTKLSHELLEYAIGTFPQDSHQRDKKHAPAPLIRKKQVTFIAQCDKSNSNTYKHVMKLNTQRTKVSVPLYTGANCCTNASGSQPRSNTKKNRISLAKGVNKLQVEEQCRTNKSHLRTSNRVDSSSCSKRT
nr:integrase, catalytic region, zinc finger, CCHC-type, peptidase aspartic, catalytic [Tanacetum cinerariifolium]